MRNNMTASMFDLSMKDKSRNPFGKLRDKIKGKRHEEPSDTASAIVPSTMHTIDSDDDSPTKDKKKKSKIKTLFSRSGLQKTPLSQSMSVLPTAKPEKLTLHPGDFQSQWEDDMEDESSSPSNSMSHRRTASADIKQLSHINLTLPKKEGLSFFGGLRSKNDQLSRSNVCINGNHVYVEQPEPKHEAVTKDSTPSSSPSPQGFRKKHLFSSTENLSSRPSKELGEAGRMSPDWQLSGSLPKDSLKSLTLPSYRPVVSDDVNVAPVNAETEKESKENKKQENRKSSLLSLVTGKKDALKNSEAESSTPSVLMKEKEITPGEAMVKEKEAGLVEIPVKDLKEKTEEDLLASVSRQSKSPSPTEEMPRMQSGAEPELKPEPKSRPPAFSARGPQTKAVKPRLGVSPEAQSKAKFSSSIRDSSLFFSATSSGSSLDSLPPKVGQETESSNSLSLLSSFSPPTIDPVSTSTPIENWPFSQESQASSEGPSFFLAVKSQKEGSIRVSSASSGFPESLDKHSPLHEGNIVSVEETGEIDIGKSKGSRESSRPSLDLLENTEDKHVTKKQKEKVPTFPPVSQTEHLPPPKDPQQNTTLVQDGKHWVKERKEFISSYGASLEGQVSDQGVVPANDGAELPHKMEDLATPFDCIVGKSNLTGLHDRQGRKKIKKHVSFSEELFPEDEVEKEESKPLELKSKGAMNDTLSDREPEEIKKKNMTAEPNSLPSPLISGARATFGLSHDEPVSVTDVFLSSASPVSMMPESHGKCSSEDLVRESSSEKVTPFRIERYQNYSENYQSKASDHEGLLSDPLRSLDLVSDLKSPVMGDLNLTLPSIPEVTSDDERVEQLEDVRTTPTTKNHLEKEIPFFGSSATSSEEENLSPSVEQNPDAGVNTLFQEEENALQVEKHEDFVNSSILSSKQTPALSVCKLPHREGLGLDKDIPIPESLEKQEWREEDNYTEESRSQRSSSQGSPVSGHSLSENFNATHSFPGSLHSDTYHTNRAESPQKTSAESLAAKVENSDKRKQLLRAWVSPSEPHPFPAQPTSGTTVSAKHRTHPVKPMNTTATKTAPTSLGTATIISENLLNEAIIKKYKPSDPEFAYTQLTHDELIQLVLKQKETINKKEFQVRELEDYIDNLLVRVMEETPNILRSPAQLKNKAGKM
ncbi:rab11 family-interacting protein 1 isoform X2 [Petaurus breviceps papuanus]